MHHFIQKTFLKRFHRDDKGAAAIEFSIVALPFFAILFAIFEIAMIYWAQGVLTEAVLPQARRGMTGEIQKTSSFTVEDFRQSICERVNGMMDCSKFIIDARTLQNFSEQNNPSLMNGTTGTIIPTDFNLGAKGDIVMIRVGYPWQTIFPFTSLMSFDLSNMGNGQRLLQVTSVIRNEQF